MPAQTAKIPENHDRETALAVVLKWMAGGALSPVEAALIDRLRALNMAQQLGSAVPA